VTETSLPSIEALNALEREAFVESLRALFEGGDPLLAALWSRRPFAGYPQMLEEAAQVCQTLSEAEKQILLNAHPRIGAPPAELARGSRLSFAEQGYGSGAPDPRDERLGRELERLNASYETRFGFRFVIFVNRRPRAALIPVLRARLARAREEEMETALGELFAIARDRMRTLSGP